MEGVAVYADEETSTFYCFTSILADPEKRKPGFLALIASYFPPLGLEDPRCREEYWMDFDAERAKLLYHAWSPTYNVVPEFDLAERGFSRRFLCFDFGDQTAVLFAAQNPVTQQIVVYDEVYPYRELVSTIQQKVYERFAEHHQLSMAQEDAWRINDFCEDIIGDPRGASLAREFGEGSLPISIRCKGIKTPDGSRYDDHERGRARVNSLLAPSFWHCGRRQHARTKNGSYSTLGVCAFCGHSPLQATPLFVVMQGRAPNLVRTWPEQVKETPRPGEIETDKEQRGIEDHMWDTVRYLCARIHILEPTMAAIQNLRDRPVATLTASERVQRILDDSFLTQRRDDAAGILPEHAYVAMGPGGATMIIEGFHGDDGMYEEDDD